MTDKVLYQQAVRRLRKRHPSETTLLRRDGRYVNRKLVQAAPDEDRWDFWWLMLAAVVAAPLVWGVLFAFFMFVAPGPVPR